MSPPLFLPLLAGSFTAEAHALVSHAVRTLIYFQFAAALMDFVRLAVAAAVATAASSEYCGCLGSSPWFPCRL
jgi:hypothetical protein